MGRANLKMMRVGRGVAFLTAAALLLPFTILLMMMDQQYSFAYNSRRLFYQESDFYKFNGSFTIPTSLSTTTLTKSQYILENSIHEEGILSREMFVEVGARMDARREHLVNTCHKLGLDSSSSKANAWEFLINKQYHVIWCNIFKAASTSWMYNFNLMANYTAAFLDKTAAVPVQLARKKYARPTVEMIRKAQADSITFLIVRHPLERLASAYNDKIVHAFPWSTHDKLGKRIIARYRKKDKPPVPTEKYPVFEEFVSYVLNEAHMKRELDMHWVPYSNFCSPCKFNFDIIMKFETLEEDQKYFIQLARLQDVVKPEWKNSGKGANTKTIINTLYSRLTKPQLDGLYRLYKNDFQLFNYSIDSYYDIVSADG